MTAQIFLLIHLLTDGMVQQTYVGHMHIIVGLHPPLFICMVDVKSLYLQQTCVFSLSIVLVMCSCNLSMELSRTFLHYHHVGLAT